MIFHFTMAKSYGINVKLWASQTITFGTLADKTYGDANFSLTAKMSFTTKKDASPIYMILQVIVENAMRSR